MKTEATKLITTQMTGMDYKIKIFFKDGNKKKTKEIMFSEYEDYSRRLKSNLLGFVSVER